MKVRGGGVKIFGDATSDFYIRLSGMLAAAPVGGASTLNWIFDVTGHDVYWFVNYLGATLATGLTPSTGSGLTEITGSANLMIPGGTGGSLDIFFLLTGTDRLLTVSIPPHSLDVGLSAPTATPEPASMLLVLAGAGGMLALRRRRAA